MSGEWPDVPEKTSYAPPRAPRAMLERSLPDYGLQQNTYYSHGLERRRSLSPDEGQYYNRKRKLSKTYQSLPDPYALDRHVTFNYFSTWYNTVNPQARFDYNNSAIVQEQYDMYRKAFHIRTGTRIAMNHVDDAWFRERYDSAAAPLNVALSPYRQWLYGIFEERLQSGKLDGIHNDAEEENGQDEDGQDELASLGVRDLHPLLSRDVALIKSVDPMTPRDRVVHACEEIPGYKYLSVSDPKQDKKFVRSAWILLDDTGSPEEATRLLQGKQIGEEGYMITLHTTRYNLRDNVPKRRRLHEKFSDPDAISRDLGNTTTLSKKFEGSTQFKGSDAIQQRVSLISEGFDELSRSKKHLALNLEYLRTVFGFCYYSVYQADSLLELIRCCGPGHQRKSGPTGESVDYELARWKERLQLVLSTDALDQSKYGAKLEAEAMDDYVRTLWNVETEGRVRCLVPNCGKLFKDEEYVRKHLEKRHQEVLEKQRKKIMLINAYLLDPNRALMEGFADLESRATNADETTPPTAPRKDLLHDRRENMDPAARQPLGRKQYQDLDKMTQEVPELDY